jgi:hypothetical protein
MKVQSGCRFGKRFTGRIAQSKSDQRDTTENSDEAIAADLLERLQGDAARLLFAGDRAVGILPTDRCALFVRS